LLEDVRWDRREIVIRASVAKSKRTRIIPISASVPALRRYLKLRTDSAQQTESFFLSFYSTPVFAGGSGRSARRPAKSFSLSTAPLTRVGLYQLVRKWGALAGLTESRCSPHTFRHYFASQYLRRGGDIVTLQRMLGHSRLDVTERYLKLSGADVRASHERYSPAAELFGGERQRHRHEH
jgi:site-specific recombinase XerD